MTSRLKTATISAVALAATLTIFLAPQLHGNTVGISFSKISTTVVQKSAPATEALEIMPADGRDTLDARWAPLNSHQ